MSRRSVGVRQWVLGGAALSFVVGVSGAAAARPTITIPECAQASTIRSTIDPKKKADAARKRRQVDQLMAACRAKAAASPPTPTAQSKPAGGNNVNKVIRRRERPTPTPVQPRPVAVQQPAPPPPRQKKGNLFEQLGGILRTNSRPAPPPRTQPAPRPRPAAPAPAAQAPFVPAAAPAPAPAPAAPIAPVVYTPPPPPPPATSTTEQRNVFGIQLGEALTLPACAPGVVNATNPKAFDSSAKTKQKSVTASCAQTGAAAQTLAQRMADMEGKPVPSGVQFSLVRLAADRCPDWLSGSCTLSVATKSGVALSVAFLTIEDAERDIVRNLGSKYGARPNTRDAAACDVPGAAGAPATRRMGNDNGWKFADLNLSYWAVSGLNCGQGRVLVQTSTFVELAERAMAGDGQPTM